jgi:hypothetical protein
MAWLFNWLVHLSHGPGKFTMNAQNENDWITPRRFASLLAALIFVSWPGILLGLQTFVYRDFGFFYDPVAWHMKESFWRMEWPLWNPLNDCGQPFLAEWNTQALYPPALFYVLLPLPWSLGVFFLAHLFLGGLGMFLLARHWTQNSFGAAVAGVVFAFSGLMLSGFLWMGTVAALGWMPWVVWLTRRAWTGDGRTVLIAVAVGTLQMLSGGVEVVLLTWALLGALAVTEFISGNAPRGKIIWRFGIIVVLITGLCAVQLLPFFDLLKHSQRQGNYSGADSPTPPTGWVNFLLPLFRCEPNQGIFVQSWQYWVISYYTGIITVALAALALLRRPSLWIWSMGTLAALCVVLATGNATPLYPWLRTHVGIVGLIRFPVKFVILPVFVLPLMAAYTLAGAKNGGGKENAVYSIKTWLFLWLGAIAFISVCLVWQFKFQPSNGENMSMLFNGVVRVIFFTAIVIGLFVIGKTVPSKLRCWLQMFVLLLIWADLGHQVPQPANVNPNVFRPNMSRPLPAPQFGESRAMIPNDVLQTLTFASQPDAAQSFLSHRFAMFSDCNLLDDIPKCDGFFALELKEHDLLSGNVGEPLLDFLGVSETLAIRTNALEWMPRATPMPLLTAGQKPIFASDADTLASLTDNQFNPRAQVYLPLEAQDAMGIVAAGTVKISPERFSAQEIDASVDASTNTMLVAAQSYYHNWRAYVDGQPTALCRANYAFQAMEIPAGTHQVRLIYVDWNFRAGAIVSLATLAGMLIFYGSHLRLKKN